MTWNRGLSCGRSGMVMTACGSGGNRRYAWFHHLLQKPKKRGRREVITAKLAPSPTGLAWRVGNRFPPVLFPPDRHAANNVVAIDPVVFEGRRDMANGGGEHPVGEPHMDVGG